MKIDAHKDRDYRVWLDGVEVTQDCEIAILGEADESNAVLLLKRDNHGRFYLGPDGEIAKEWKHGEIMIFRNTPGVA